MSKKLRADNEAQVERNQALERQLSAPEERTTNKRPRIDPSLTQHPSSSALTHENTNTSAANKTPQGSTPYKRSRLDAGIPDAELVYWIKFADSTVVDVEAVLSRFVVWLKRWLYNAARSIARSTSRPAQGPSETILFPRSRRKCHQQVYHFQLCGPRLPLGTAGRTKI